MPSKALRFIKGTPYRLRIRSGPERLEHRLSHNIRHKTANEVIADTRDLFQRKPAMVFGVTAAVGFVAYRLLSVTQASSRQPNSLAGAGARQYPTNPKFQSAGSRFESTQRVGGHVD